MKKKRQRFHQAYESRVPAILPAKGVLNKEGSLDFSAPENLGSYAKNWEETARATKRSHGRTARKKVSRLNLGAVAGKKKVDK